MVVVWVVLGSDDDRIGDVHGSKFEFMGLIWSIIPVDPSNAVKRFWVPDDRHPR